MKALIVVDVQKDFVDKGALAVPNALQIIEPINILIKKYKNEGSVVVATQDFHPLKHISFASTHNKKPLDIIDVSYGKQQL
jgi:nicotinamidase/pyrazinamidase